MGTFTDYMANMYAGKDKELAASRNQGAMNLATPSAALNGSTTDDGVYTVTEGQVANGNTLPGAGSSKLGAETVRAEQATTPTTGTATASRAPERTGSLLTSDDIVRILGESPEQQRIRQEREQAGAQKVAGWLGLFDGLRYLGQAAGVIGGAPYQQLSDTGAQYLATAKEKQEQRKEQDAATAAYKMNIYKLQKEAEARQQELAELERTHKRQEAADAREEREMKAKEAYYGIRDDKTKADIDVAKARKADIEAKTAKTEEETDNLRKGLTPQGKDPNKTTSRSGSKGGSKSSSSSGKTAVSKEANSWAKAHPADARAFWSNHPKTTENERIFNEQCRKKYQKSTSTTTTTTSNKTDKQQSSADAIVSAGGKQ